MRKCVCGHVWMAHSAGRNKCFECDCKQLRWTVFIDGRKVESGSRWSRNKYGTIERNPDWRKTVRECMEFWRNAGENPSLHLRRG